MSDFDNLSHYLKAIADPTRLKIVDLLNRHSSPICVNALASKLNVTQSAISQHLRILKHIGLVTSTRNGYHINYELKYDQFRHYSSLLDSVISPSQQNTNSCDDDCHKS